MSNSKDEVERIDWLEAELADTIDEDYELELSEPTLSEKIREIYRKAHPPALPRMDYFRALLALQAELIKLQDWVVYHKQKVVVIFEGRDAAGKGGVIKRITQRLNPRIVRTVALPAPSDREKTQWYFQRYVPHLPAGGEIVLFDRSWYNRCGVERVMGFATEEEVEQFFDDVPEFERMLVRSGVRLVKYWFSITDEEQQLRFLTRIHDPLTTNGVPHSPLSLFSTLVILIVSPDRVAGFLSQLFVAAPGGRLMNVHFDGSSSASTTTQHTGMLKSSERSECGNHRTLLPSALFRSRDSSSVAASAMVSAATASEAVAPRGAPPRAA